ncbi:MAG TPA: acyltransferase [Rudaea sp.]
MESDIVPSSHSTAQRYGAIDGIRGWMSFVVLLHHCYLFLVLTALRYDSPWLHFVTAGHFAVLVFFVLSGFALSVGFLQTADAAVLKHLALRRYPRLAVPMLASCVLAYGLMKFGLMANSKAAILTNDPAWLGSFYNFEPSFLRMLRFAGLDAFVRYSAAETYNPNLWTMSTELIGSFVVFASLLLSPPRLIAAVQILLGAVFLYLVSWYFCFACGTLLAVFALSDWRARARRVRWWGVSPLAALSLLASVAAVAYITFRPPPAVLERLHLDSESVEMTAAAVFVFGCLNVDIVRKLFESRLSQFMGRISFPLYLVQIPLICSFSSLLYLAFVERHWPLFEACAVTIAFTIALALLVSIFFLPIERAAIRTARSFSVRLLRGSNPVPADADPVGCSGERGDHATPKTPSTA